MMDDTMIEVTNPGISLPDDFDYTLMASSSPSTAVATSASWLDAVPGARTAYNFIVAKLSEFHVIGLNKLPGYEALLNGIQTRVLGSGDPALQRLYDQARQDTQAMRAKWNELEPKVRDVASKLTQSGLGVLPLATLLALAGTMVLVASGMYLFFNADARNEDTIRELVDRATAQGIISTDEATRLLRSGSGSGLASLGNGMVVVALVAAAIYFLPRRRNA